MKFGIGFGVSFKLWRFVGQGMGGCGRTNKDTKTKKTQRQRQNHTPPPYSGPPRISPPGDSLAPAVGDLDGHGGVGRLHRRPDCGLRAVRADQQVVGHGLARPQRPRGGRRHGVGAVGVGEGGGALPEVDGGAGGAEVEADAVGVEAAGLLPPNHRFRVCF